MENEKKIELLRQHFKTTNAGLEKIFGLSNGYISNIENNEVDNPGKLLVALSSQGISTDWFLKGEGPVVIESLGKNSRLTSKPNDAKFLHKQADKSTSKNGLPGIPLVYEGAEGLEDGIVIPLLENAVSAGYGSGVDDNDTPVRYIQVPHHLSKYPHLAGLPVKGDSMEPTLHDGDLVVCDGGGWDGDGIYVLKTHDTSYVKRVQMTSQGYEVISDNRMYKSITERAESLTIVGKVRAILVIVPGRRGGV